MWVKLASQVAPPAASSSLHLRSFWHHDGNTGWVGCKQRPWGWLLTASDTQGQIKEQKTQTDEMRASVTVKGNFSHRFSVPACN